MPTSRKAPEPAHWRWFGDVCLLNVAGFAWWGWCLAPAGHPVFSTSANFATMAGVASQQTWGAVMLVVCALFLVGCYQSDYRTQIAALVIAAAFWMLLAGALFSANRYAPGAGMYGSLALVTLSRAVRLARIA